MRTPWTTITLATLAALLMSGCETKIPADDGADIGGNAPPPAGSCTVPEWGEPRSHCSGDVLAQGSMNNHDEGSYAASQCAAGAPSSTCCEFHLYGEGVWRATNGSVQQGWGAPLPDGNIGTAGVCNQPE